MNILKLKQMALSSNMMTAEQIYELLEEYSKNQDYTSFEVYPTISHVYSSDALKYDISADQIESFTVLTDAKKSSIDITVDWGDGCSDSIKDMTNMGLTETLSEDELQSKFADGVKTIADWHGEDPETVPEGQCRYVSLAHKYDVSDNDTKFVVKMYGTTYFGLKHGNSQYSHFVQRDSEISGADAIRNANSHNLVCRMFGNGLNTYSKLTDSDSFCSQSDRLSCIDIQNKCILENSKDFSKMFNGCRNLKKIKGMNWILNSNNIQKCEGLFQHCYSLNEIDVVLPRSVSETNSNKILRTDVSCLNDISCDVLDMLPMHGFQNSIDDFSETFKGMSSLSCSDYDKLRKILWGNSLSAGWIGTDCFTSCYGIDLLRIPLSWGGCTQRVSYVTGGNRYSNPGLILQKSDVILTSPAAIVQTSECMAEDAVADLLADDENIVSFISESLISAGTAMFSGCQSLSAVSLHNVTTLRSETFLNCQSLVSAYLPNVSLMTGAGGWFTRCLSLSDLRMANVKRMDGMQALYKCASLSSVDLPRLEYAGKLTFSGCSALLSIDLPNLSSCGWGLFRDCPNLTSVSLPRLISSEYAENVAKSSRLFGGCVKLSSVDYPNKTEIAKEEFAYHYGDGQNFRACEELRTVTCPKVEQISEDAFKGCVNLSVIDFSSKVTDTIPELVNANAFSNTNDTYEILVPSRLYDTWITSGKWPSISSHIRSV